MSTKNLIKKATFATFFIFGFFLSTVVAQNDTMYVMKNGAVVGKYNVNTEVDSVIFYQPVMQPGNTFTDSRDGHVYHTVTIGAQVWMEENLGYLPSVVGPVTESYSAPCYYVFGYSGTSVFDAKATANYNTYGVLYNWPAAMASSASSSANPSGVQGVCPTGWHLPSDAEWTQLTDYLGGASVAGGKLKEAGTTHWNSPNAGATNESGFTALPGGYRYDMGEFFSTGSYGYWWCATAVDNILAWGRLINYNFGNVDRYNYLKELGMSVRCVRN